MWVIGGWNGSRCLGDVWSSPDGAHWTCVAESAGWRPRHGHASVVHDGRIWVLGGWNDSCLNDVWSSADGIHWTEATDSAVWPRRSEFGCAELGDSMWIMGGANDTGTYAVWHVVSKDTLERIQHDPQSTRTMIVTLTSPTTCRLDVRDELKPGFSDYAFLRISTHTMGYFSSYRVTGTSCTIH